MSKSDVTTQEGTADQKPPTCPHGERFCPIDNPVVEDRLECWGCRLELARADERPADAIHGP